MAVPSFLNTSHQTVAWFVSLSNQDRLTLRPPFQRRPVWNDEAKAFLVDTILRGYPVPEVYVYTFDSEIEGEDDNYAIVDGQQRLRTCLEFLADSFPVTFNVDKLEPLFTLADTPWFGKRYSELTKDEKDRFRKYKFIVRELEGVGDSQIRHMFHRLNQSNVVLNAQELRYSMYAGGLLDTVETLVARDEWEGFRLFTTNQRRRMLDSEFVSELVIGHLHWPQNKKDNLDHYYRQYTTEFPFRADVEDRFVTVLKTLTELFPRPRMSGTRWYRKSDFYTLFLAISRGKIDVSGIGMDRLRELLTEFSKKIGSAGEFADGSPVQVYNEAVARAATDRSRRLRREEALLSFLKGEPLVGQKSILDFTGVPAEAELTDEDLEDEDDEEYVDRESEVAPDDE